MCEIYGFCGLNPEHLNQYTNEFWLHSRIHKDGFGFFLADKNQFYTNPRSALLYIDKLRKHDFTSKLALCHIRFKTHGPAAAENCHPFITHDTHGVRWALIHNGYIEDSITTHALSALQLGETDSERILLRIVESVNQLYEHVYIEDYDELLELMYQTIEATVSELSELGKTNLIFTDNATGNMYVYMNSPKTLFYLKTNTGYHISTTRLTDENWQPVIPYRLHIFNNGNLIRN